MPETGGSLAEKRYRITKCFYWEKYFIDSRYAVNAHARFGLFYRFSWIQSHCFPEVSTNVSHCCRIGLEIQERNRSAGMRCLVKERLCGLLKSLTTQIGVNRQVTQKHISNDLVSIYLFNCSSKKIFKP
jgi:hypothetical protein